MCFLGPEAVKTLCVSAGCCLGKAKAPHRFLPSEVQQVPPDSASSPPLPAPKRTDTAID